MEKQNKVIIPNGGEAVMAKYRDQEVMEYRNNPFIEALPPILSKEEVVDKLAYYPPFNENERNLDSHIRLHLVQRLFQYYQPIFQTLDLESRVSRMIRMGYVHNNPFKPEFAQGLHENYKSILNANIDMYNGNLKSTSSAMTILGPSGIGKSRMINVVLSALPQLIVHSRYKNNDFNMYQLVWLKLDCSFDGNIKGVCIDAYRSLDSLLGTSYYKRFGSARMPIASMQPALSQMLRVHGVGLLVIDEVQSLSVAKSGGAEKMMNFFHYLSNMGTPILLIGTPKALPYLRGDLRQARRGSGQGDMVIERMKKDFNWDLILEGMWDYQWVRKPTALTQEFKDILYDESGGITDIAIKLFVMAQVKAISSGKEQITPALIRKVARENLQLIQPMINAIRSGDIKAISRYEDIAPIDVEGFINQEFSTVSMNNKIKEIQKAKKKQEKNWKENVREQSILKLIELDVEPGKAKKCIDTVIEKQGQEFDIKGIVKEAFKLSINIEESSPIPTKLPKKMELQNKQDLRLIVSEGKANGLSAHEALKEKGIIKVIENDFFSVG
ncbi:ATPase AAA [Ureibacillus massiliensis 4400831 = CIP 108448 = CCUG 49529]|uniref:ATPase AAA n=1 Tax=Ureibacillus massiliensis 4400831 = CIP 108448 = CCUG 49529 TaxID=1211035 RepID=A0A0A3JS94_9BACL|nr:ATP-binding protein [Ureibacillus massiliensis]KGR89867.1 ATPase AAA [Ureibacillus massiliensis 4400831 = CIP 108448 = CCUG 49529]